MPDDMANFLPNTAKLIDSLSETREASRYYTEQEMMKAQMSGDPLAIKKLLLDYHRKRVAQLESDIAGK